MTQCLGGGGAQNNFSFPSAGPDPKRLPTRKSRFNPRPGRGLVKIEQPYFAPAVDRDGYSLSMIYRGTKKHQHTFRRQ